MGSHNDHDTIQEWNLGNSRSQGRSGRSSSDKRKGKEIQEWNLDRRNHDRRRNSAVVKTVHIGGSQKTRRRDPVINRRRDADDDSYRGHDSGDDRYRSHKSHSKKRYLRKQQIFFAKIIIILIAVVCAAAVIISAVGKSQNNRATAEASLRKQELISDSDGTGAAANAGASSDSLADASSSDVSSEADSFTAITTPNTRPVGADVVSTHAVLLDCDNDTILSERNSDEQIYPASMTKVLTVLVAAESITQDQLEDTYIMDIESTDYSFSNDCSNVGFEVGEQITVKDLFYGTILCSGADAACGLAKYAGGTQDKFVEMMNDKLDELGLSESAHFTNCVGVYDDDHYCTVKDMAIIMEAAMNNDLCREVLTARKYTTSCTTEHPDGIEISNWFLRRIEDKDSGITVLGGKTGFVVQSGNCAVSYAEDSEGHGYVCATNGSSSAWRCIYDHVAIYDDFFKSSTE